jgi:hypothetical protein
MDISIHIAESVFNQMLVILTLASIIVLSVWVVKRF